MGHLLARLHPHVSDQHCGTTELVMRHVEHPDELTASWQRSNAWRPSASRLSTFHAHRGRLFGGAEGAILLSSPEYTETSAQAGGEYRLSQSERVRAGAPTCRRQRIQKPAAMAMDLSPQSVLVQVILRRERGCAVAAGGSWLVCSAVSGPWRCSMPRRLPISSWRRSSARLPRSRPCSCWVYSWRLWGRYCWCASASRWRPPSATRHTGSGISY